MKLVGEDLSHVVVRVKSSVPDSDDLYGIREDWAVAGHGAAAACVEFRCRLVILRNIGQRN